MQRERLLVIDDDEVFRRSVTRIAELADYQVMTTSEPTVARAIVASWQPSVVMVDLFSSAMDGVPLLRQLGAEGCSAQIVLTSGLDGTVLTSAFEVAGEHGLKTAGVLPKPLRPQTCRDLLIEIKSAKNFILTELAEAIAKNQLFLEYQPQLDCRFDRIMGVEALVRWRHPTRPVIPPDQFIALAEGTDLIDELTDWVFATATNQIARWRDEGLPLALAVNVSARNLRGPDFPRRLAEHCAAANLQPSSITLEITESSVMRDAAMLIDALGELRLAGFRISIDEFGTGYSSLLELRRMPLSELKIDRSLVLRMVNDQDCQVMVAIIADLARKLELQAVAVGVESEHVLRAVTALGCGAAQGYHISRPAAPDRVSVAIDEWSSKSANAVA
jgi:EAL domain-containing protein (putative c-di-GMP-specific phosphodiesterase class I)